MKVTVIELATQIKFPENFVKINQAGGSELKVFLVGWGKRVKIDMALAS